VQENIISTTSKKLRYCILVEPDVSLCIHYFYKDSFIVLQNTSENIDEKETGKVGAEFHPDPLSAPAAFWSRSLEKNWREDLPVLVSHHRGGKKLLGKVLKIWL